MKDRGGGLLCCSKASLGMHFMQIRKYALLGGPAAHSGIRKSRPFIRTSIQASQNSSLLQLTTQYRSGSIVNFLAIKKCTPASSLWLVFKRLYNIVIHFSVRHLNIVLGACVGFSNYL